MVGSPAVCSIPKRKTSSAVRRERQRFTWITSLSVLWDLFKEIVYQSVTWLTSLSVLRDLFKEIVYESFTWITSLSVLWDLFKKTVRFTGV
jgi:hypothetical protein